jgi:hypothetical protein
MDTVVIRDAKSDDLDFVQGLYRHSLPIGFIYCSIRISLSFGKTYGY